jgi:hypothetical protein
MTSPRDPSKRPWAQGAADLLLDDYLLGLGQAARKLPLWQRELFLDEVADQIDDALQASGPVDVATMREVLDQFGDPKALVQAGEIVSDWPGGQELAAVLVLLVGGVVLPVVGWVVGVVLLWASPRWRPAEKLLGTLVWPGGLLAFAATAWLKLASYHNPGVLLGGDNFYTVVILGVIAAVPPVVVAVRLLHSARRPARRLAGRRETAASQTAVG